MSRKLFYVLVAGISLVPFTKATACGVAAVAYAPVAVAVQTYAPVAVVQPVAVPVAVPTYTQSVQTVAVAPTYAPVAVNAYANSVAVSASYGGVSAVRVGRAHVGGVSVVAVSNPVVNVRVNQRRGFFGASRTVVRVR